MIDAMATSIREEIWSALVDKAIKQESWEEQHRRYAVAALNVVIERAADLELADGTPLRDWLRGEEQG